MSAPFALPPPGHAAARLYLAQILVSREDAVRVLRIRDSYDWHQRVWQAFGGRDGHARDFLIRVDGMNDTFRVLVLSQTPPTKPEWCPPDCFRVRLVPDEFFKHRRYRFSLLANPTKKIRVDKPDGTRKRNGRRVPLTGRDELAAWLARKAEGGGFSIHPSDLRTMPRGREVFSKAGARGAHCAVEFQGELTVTNPALFHATVTNGVGSAKAFGFGLLVIVPILRNSPS